MKKKHTFFAATGIPSLFLIFAVLCLTVFSLLTLGSSRSALNSARLSMKQTESYYKSCKDASGIISQIDSFLSEAFTQSTDEVSYYDLADKIPDKVSQLKVQSLSDHIYILSVAFTDTQSLSITVKFLYPDKEGESLLDILQWKTENTASWNPDTRQSVYKQGGTE